MSYAADPDVPVLKWPTAIEPESVQLHLQSLTSRFVSPLSRTVQTQELPGARWRLSFTLPAMYGHTDARTLRAFLARLRGSSGRFYFRAEVSQPVEVPDAAAAEPSYSAPLTADNATLTADRVANTADATLMPAPYPVAATGSSIDPTRLVGSTSHPVGSTVLPAGRHISFDGPSGWRRLHLVVEDAVVQPGGQVVFVVEPPLREFPAVGAALHLSNPSGIFQLVDDDQGALTLAQYQIASSLTLSAIEANPLQL